MPRSVNAQKKKAYYEAINSSFQQYHSAARPVEGVLYGFVYYFHKFKSELDADNLSKPVWDALQSTVYVDDKQIRFRSAASFNLKAEGIELLDLTDMPDYLFEDFLKMVELEDHILYIELGKFDYELFRFGYEK